MSDITKSDKAVAQAIDKRANGQADNEIRLSTGVVLTAKQANPNVLIRIMTAVPRPKPPTYFDEMMNKELENPDHPDYRKQVEAWEMQYNNGMLNALVGLGTELKSKPKNIPSPENDTWLADYEALGLPVVKGSKAWRYITWVLFVAATTDKDTQLIAEKVKSLSGVKEDDVQAAESFPDGDNSEGQS
jgi:hypothetical protein